METEFFIHTLFTRLRRRRFPLAYEDYQALRQALRAGFGWESPQELCTLCGALWAKTLQEREMVAALFQEVCRELEIEQWELPQEEPEPEQIEGRSLHRVIASEMMRRVRKVIPLPGEPPEAEPVELRELLLPKLEQLTLLFHLMLLLGQPECGLERFGIIRILLRVIHIIMEKQKIIILIF